MAPRGAYKDFDKLTPAGKRSRRKREAAVEPETVLGPTLSDAEREAIEAEQEARATYALLSRQSLELKRAIKIKRARESLADFCEYMMPDPEFPDDADKSLFVTKPHHRLLIDGVEQVEQKTLMRSAWSLPPQHGKTSILSLLGLAWILGRHPNWRVIVGVYSEDRAQKVGSQLRDIMLSDRFAEVFPKCSMKKGSKAKDDMEFTAGGQVILRGRGTATTGEPCDLFLIDDPIKDAAEAASPAVRQTVKDWYAAVVYSRCRVGTPIMIVHCMTGDTPVLMESGAEKPLRDIRVGDRVATYDNGKVSASTVRNWINNGPDRVFEIRMQSGVTVKANARHPFLVEEDGDLKWQRTDTLKKGSVILKVTGGSGKARHAPLKDAASPLSAGGCASITTASTAGKMVFGRRLPPILREGAQFICALATASASRIMSAFFRSKVAFAPSASSPPTAKTHAPIGARGFASIIAMTARLFGVSCATTAISRSDTPKPKAPSLPPLNTYEVTTDTVADVVAAGVEDVFDVQIDRTENFIANGLVSHNTRWSEDDLIGWLCDPEHPENKANPSRIARWKYINIPAVVKDKALAKVLGLALKVPTDPNVIKAFGEVPMAALWSEEFSLRHLAEAHGNSPRSFYALYMGQPAPEDGDFFKDTYIIPYHEAQRPETARLRIYAASDHAVGLKQRNDLTCLLVVGVDMDGVIWLLDCWWDKAPTDKVAEKMIDMMERWRPIFWWAEAGHISKSMGPHLRKRMAERKVYINLVEQHPAADKVTRAQSINGRAAMGMVRFPAAAAWYEPARKEILKFPNGRHDDFVDTLAHIGLGLDLQSGPGRRGIGISDSLIAPPIGTLSWVKHQARIDQRTERRHAAIRNL